jgi:hypothetical protein
MTLEKAAVLASTMRAGMGAVGGVAPPGTLPTMAWPPSLTTTCSTRVQLKGRQQQERDIGWQLAFTPPLRLRRRRDRGGVETVANDAKPH